MYELSINIGQEDLENGIKDTLLEVEEMATSGDVIYTNLIRSLGKKWGDNVAGIILKVEQLGFIGREEIKEVKRGMRVRPISITEKGKKKLAALKSKNTQTGERG